MVVDMANVTYLISLPQGREIGEGGIHPNLPSPFKGEVILGGHNE